MAISNADLAEKISTLIDFWSQLTVEYKNWLGGSVGGGPSSDGKYPLTNFTGDEILVECPARLSDDVGGFVDQAETSATEAAASATAALASEDEALVQKGLAVDARVLAQTARTEAETAESSAVDAKTTAITQANLATDRAGYAEEWANLEFETLVSAAAGGDQTDDYSALHWSVVAAGFAGNIDSGLYGQLAQDETITGLWDFDNTLTYDLINGPATSSRDKLRVYNNNNYVIGMQEAITFGGLSDWAMTFSLIVNLAVAGGGALRHTAQHRERWL